MKESARTGLQDSGTTAAEDAETPNKENRITNKNDPIVSLVEDIATEVAT